jgi:hypothetical protein
MWCWPEPLSQQVRASRTAMKTRFTCTKTTYLIQSVPYIQNMNLLKGMWQADVKGICMTLSQLMHCYPFVVREYLRCVKLQWLSSKHAMCCTQHVVSNWWWTSILNLKGSSFVNKVTQLYLIIYNATESINFEKVNMRGCTWMKP